MSDTMNRLMNVQYPRVDAESLQRTLVQVKMLLDSDEFRRLISLIEVQEQQIATLQAKQQEFEDRIYALENP